MASTTLILARIGPSISNSNELKRFFRHPANVPRRNRSPKALWSSPAAPPFGDQDPGVVRREISPVKGARWNPDLGNFLDRHDDSDDQSTQLPPEGTQAQGATGQRAVQQMRHDPDQKNMACLVSERETVDPAKEPAPCPAISANNDAANKHQPDRELEPTFQTRSSIANPPGVEGKPSRWNFISSNPVILTRAFLRSDPCLVVSIG